jgi:glucose-1-phosphate thymidylyltransferase
LIGIYKINHGLKEKLALTSNKKNFMKGIILAGGSGTRLHPSTISVSKQLLPVYDKPLIYYPLSNLLAAGIDDILIISTSDSIPLYKKLFQDGSHLGIKISYKKQDRPNGIAEAFIIGEEFIDNEDVALVLGDNIFYGNQVIDSINEHSDAELEGAKIFAYKVPDPQRYGVVEFNKKNSVMSIEEKPESPKSYYAVTGLYVYDKEVCNLAKKLSPSSRNELEITDLNNLYLNQNKLEVVLLDSGTAWLDAGTPDSLLEAAHFVQTIQNRQLIQIGCLEEISFRKGFINKDQFKKLAINAPKNKYGEYLRGLINFI